MTIIRDLDKNDRVIKPLNIREWSEMYLHYVRNAEWENDLINKTILDLGVFESYESNNSFDSDTLSS